MILSKPFTSEDLVGQTEFNRLMIRGMGGAPGEGGSSIGKVLAERPGRDRKYAKKEEIQLRFFHPD